VTPKLHARAAAQHIEHLVEPCVQAMDAEQRHACGGQLDGKRDAVQPPADVDDDRHVVVGQPKARSTACARSTNSATAPNSAASFDLLHACRHRPAAPSR
jgi:hypothetical protein